LDKKTFEEGIHKIELSFTDFQMTKEKADLWFELVKNLDANFWNEKIDNCIVYCRKTPVLADILDHNDYYSDPHYRNLKEKAMACKKRNPGCYTYSNTDDEQCQVCKDL
jgi:hypothetical protein